ncbi:hypothetical protein ACS0TY_022831 [Phlomoides rotata]
MCRVYQETTKPSSSSASSSSPALTTSTSITETVNGSHDFKITGCHASICFPNTYIMNNLLFLLVLNNPTICPLVEQDSKTLQQLLPEIPFWVKNPDYDRVDWLNKFLEVMWPHLDKKCSNTEFMRRDGTCSNQKVIGPAMPSAELLAAAAKLPEAEAELREAELDGEGDLFIGPPHPAVVKEALLKQNVLMSIVMVIADLTTILHFQITRIISAEADSSYDIVGANNNMTAENIKKRLKKQGQQLKKRSGYCRTFPIGKVINKHKSEETEDEVAAQIMDVTMPLNFLVTDSGQLKLHEGVQKSEIMGFCDPSPGEAKALYVAYAHPNGDSAPSNGASQCFRPQLLETFVMVIKVILVRIS